MMWQQLQLAAAVRTAAARDQARQNMLAAKASSKAPPATTPSSVAPSSRTSKRSVEDSNLEEEWRKLGEWATPALPQHVVELDTEDHKAFRDSAHSAITMCLQADLAASTIKTYESLISHEVGLASKNLNIDLLPMITEAQFSAFFGSFLVTHKDELKWSKVRSLKAALVQWHKRRQQKCIFDAWTPTMVALWNGLARHSSHGTRGKGPISFGAVTEYLERDRSSATAAAVRNTAMVAVAFFGLRRSAEVIAMKIKDVVEDDANGINLVVRCQKNDQRGLGQICFIPHILAMQANSPAMVLREWMVLRSTLIASEDVDLPLFITTTGKKGSPVSYDSFRKHVQDAFGSSLATHSLRKGGAVYYARAGVVEDATRQQGGWRTTTVMNSIYITLNRKEVQQELMGVVNVTSAACTVRNMFKLLGKSAEEVLQQPPQSVLPFLKLVTEYVPNFDRDFLIQSKLVASVHLLIRHSDADVQSQATHLYTLARSVWMSTSESKKAKVA